MIFSSQMSPQNHSTEKLSFCPKKLYVSKFQYIESRLVTLDEQSFIRQYCLTISRIVMNFKKRRENKISISTCRNVLMHALSKLFIFNRNSIFSAALSYFTLRLTDIVIPASTTSYCIDNIPSVASKVMTDFKGRSSSLESNGTALLQIVTALARSTACYPTIWIFFTE